MKLCLCSLTVALAIIAAHSVVALEPIRLPPPQVTGGKPLMQTLAERKTTREFRPDPLPRQMLANLLWAAWGINRSETGGRTAPSAMNSQEIDLLVALPEGVFRYVPKDHLLQPVQERDVRSLTGGGPFAGVAPVALLYVADLSRLTKAKPGIRERYAGIDTGFISQNVYLFCASAGLATVVHEVDRNRLPAALKLTEDQRLILGQAVGYGK